MVFMFGTWNVRILLKGEALKSLKQQLLNYKVSSNTGDGLGKSEGKGKVHLCTGTEVL